MTIIVDCEGYLEQGGRVVSDVHHVELRVEAEGMHTVNPVELYSTTMGSGVEAVLKNCLTGDEMLRWPCGGYLAVGSRVKLPQHFMFAKCEAVDSASPWKRMDELNGRKLKSVVVRDRGGEEILAKRDAFVQSGWVAYQTGRQIWPYEFNEESVL